MNKEALKQAGLTEGEIKVYLALLELTESTTGPIIEKSGIARSIIYQILDKLIEKGLVSYIIKEKTKYFQAANPKKIIEYAEDNAKKAQKNIEEIRSLIPELLSKNKSAPKSHATIYFGLKGIRTAHENTYEKLKKGEEYVYLGIPAYQPEEQHLYWQRDHIRRAKAGIKIRGLFNQGTDPKVLKNRNSYGLADIRYMPTDIQTPATFVIYKDTVTIILQSPEEIAVEIVNQSIADTFKAYFDDFWKLSKPFKYKK